MKSNYKTFDDFDQKYTVYRKMYAFSKIENFELLTDALSNWTKAEKLCALLNKVREEALSLESLMSAPEMEVKVLGEAYKLYCDILEGENAIDFSAIQSEMLSLIETNCDVLESLREKFKYFIVDEYQDVNIAQEKIIRYFADRNTYICVVGDDDQTIYQWRGSNLTFIKDFATRYNDVEKIDLDTNFRSSEGVTEISKQVINRNKNRIDKNGEIVKAKMVITDNGYMLLKGSYVESEERAPSFKKHIYYKIRTKLENDNLFIKSDIDGLWVTKEDIPFKACSAAAAVVKNRATNGRAEWKLADGTTLDEFERK